MHVYSHFECLKTGHVTEQNRGEQAQQFISKGILPPGPLYENLEDCSIDTRGERFGAMTIRAFDEMDSLAMLIENYSFVASHCTLQ